MLGKAITSPFAILAKVRGGRVAYMQFMEDTYGTASTSAAAEPPPTAPTPRAARSSSTRAR